MSIEVPAKPVSACQVSTETALNTGFDGGILEGELVREVRQNNKTLVSKEFHITILTHE